MDTNSSFSARLDYLQKTLKASSGRSFANSIGITNANLQSYKKGSQPSLDILIKILSNVENLNPEWLLLGKGDVFIEKKEEKVEDGISDKMTDRLISIIESQQRTIENISKK